MTFVLLHVVHFRYQPPKTFIKPIIIIVAKTGRSSTFSLRGFYKGLGLSVILAIKSNNQIENFLFFRGMMLRSVWASVLLSLLATWPLVITWASRLLSR